MGTWGHGIYENDTAADILVELYDRFETEASTYLDSGRISDVEPDEMAQHVLVHLDLIRLLAEGAHRTKERTFDSLLFTYQVPERSRLEVWKQRMIEAHTGWMRRLYSSPTDRKRCNLEGEYDPEGDMHLAVIIELFDRLLELSKSPPPIQQG